MTRHGPAAEHATTVPDGIALMAAMSNDNRTRDPREDPMSTTETTEAAIDGITRDNLTEALTEFYLPVRTHRGYQESGQVAHPGAVAVALYATLSRIAAERRPDAPAVAAERERAEARLAVLEVHLPAVLDALRIAVADTAYGSRAGRFTAALDALDGSEEATRHG